MKRIVVAALFVVLVVGVCALLGRGQDKEPESLRGTYTFIPGIVEYVVFQANGVEVHVDESLHLDAIQRHPYVIYINDLDDIDALYCEGREISLEPVAVEVPPVLTEEAAWKPPLFLVFIVGAIVGVGLSWVVGG